MPKLKNVSHPHLAGATDVTYDTEGKHIITCGADCHVKVHEVAAGPR